MVMCKFGRRVTEGMGPRDRGNIVLERCQMGPLYLTKKQNIEHSMRSVQLAFLPPINTQNKGKWGLGGRSTIWIWCKASIQWNQWAQSKEGVQKIQKDCAHSEKALCGALSEHTHKQGMRANPGLWICFRVLSAHNFMGYRWTMYQMKKNFSGSIKFKQKRIKLIRLANLLENNLLVSLDPEESCL